LNRSATSETLTALSHGLQATNPSLARVHDESVSENETPTPLTPRKNDALRLLAEGLPNKGVASRLEVSEYTVKFHVNSIMGKLKAQSRTEAVALATRFGLLPL